jgi:hypothetical protein
MDAGIPDSASGMAASKRRHTRDLGGGGAHAAPSRL